MAWNKIIHFAKITNIYLQQWLWNWRSRAWLLRWVRLPSAYPQWPWGCSQSLWNKTASSTPPAKKQPSLHILRQLPISPSWRQREEARGLEELLVTVVRPEYVFRVTGLAYRRDECHQHASFFRATFTHLDSWSINGSNIHILHATACMWHVSLLEADRTKQSLGIGSWGRGIGEGGGAMAAIHWS